MEIKAEIKEEFFERNLVDVGTSSKSVTIVDWKSHVPSGCRHLVMKWVDESDIAKMLDSGFFKDHAEYLIGFPVHQENGKKRVRKRRKK